MENSKKAVFPKGLFAVLAIGGFLACGIFIGIMSVEGLTGLRLAQATGFGLLGLMMFWGALH